MQQSPKSSGKNCLVDDKEAVLIEIRAKFTKGLLGKDRESIKIIVVGLDLANNACRFC